MADSYMINRITIQNNSSKPLDISDSAGHSVSVSPDRSGLINVSVPQPPFPPHIGLTIKAGDASWSTFLEVTNQTNRLTITSDFQVLHN